MSNRFDLEQEILECWKVTTDIKLWCDQEAGVEDYRTLAAYYERKFEKLWSTFEAVIANKEL